MSLTKEQLAEWAQREVAYYADAEKWKRVEERMKREHAEQVAEWKQRDILINHYKYTQEEIDEAIRQIRIDRLKIILNPFV